MKRGGLWQVHAHYWKPKRHELSNDILTSHLHNEKLFQTEFQRKKNCCPNLNNSVWRAERTNRISFLKEKPLLSIIVRHIFREGQQFGHKNLNSILTQLPRAAGKYLSEWIELLRHTCDHWGNSTISILDLLNEIVLDCGLKSDWIGLIKMKIWKINK